MIEYRDGAIDVDDLLDLRLRLEFPTRTYEEVAAQIAGARWVVAAHDAGRLIGFARAISDGVTNGYLSSVMVDPAYQRRGIGREMIERIIGGRDHIRWILHARKEAMPFYRQLGFDDAPDIMWRDRRH